MHDDDSNDLPRLVFDATARLRDAMAPLARMRAEIAPALGLIEQVRATRLVIAAFVPTPASMETNFYAK